jgi:hypothetical protein
MWRLASVANIIQVPYYQRIKGMTRAMLDFLKFSEALFS